MDKFKNIGIIKNEPIFNEDKLNNFERRMKELKDSLSWSKEDILKEFLKLIPEFKHKETGKYLDEKM
jgi:hypothetical protein